ncbi:MAG: phenylalanine--tRNA ligase subunit alpha [Planctomycetes bacterium]|nr:phenylalanine--tRNA ligase subunit alpha [Planctomycetota bacterium]
MSDIETTKTEALAELASCGAATELEAWRVRWLGKKGPLTELMQVLKSLPADQKRDFGQSVNQLKTELTLAHQTAKESLGSVPVKTARRTDISLPGQTGPVGGLHPITQMTQTMVECMRSLGFEVVEGPEIEDEFHNFTALNIPPSHPARSEGENFYLPGGLLLRSQTSTVQVRVMENRKPPFRVIAPGRVYRPDTVDASHHYMFHQIEGLAVERGLTMKDLKTTLILFFSGLFGQEVDIRLRPNFFPFTEPSAEVDVRCTFCEGKGCSTCQSKGWIEMGGCGMVDPNVLQAVGIDPEEYSGFAFGLGIERLTMRRFQIPDIRYLTENDVRFLRQFA